MESLKDYIEKATIYKLSEAERGQLLELDYEYGLFFKYF